MAYGLNDRVREQVSAFAGGTGAVTLPVSAVSGFQTFLSGWGASGTGEYCLVIGAQWEAGFGTLNAGGTTLTRTTVYNGSSGSAVAVNFSAGTMDCFGDMPAELAQHLNMREITVASATTCDIGAVQGSSIVVSGTTTITGFGTKANRRRYVRFSGALTLTYNASSLILPGAANIITVAGDTAIFQSDASGNWRCVSYTRGAGLAFSKVTKQTFTSSGTYTPSAGMVFCIIRAAGGGGGGGGAAASASGISGGGGGGAGSVSAHLATASDIGTSKTVTIGAAGAAGNTSGTNGTAGGDTSVGSLCIGKGASPGTGAAANASGAGGAGGVAGTGNLSNPSGAPGGSGYGAGVVTAFFFGGFGGSGAYGAGGGVASTAGTGNGSGGSGGLSYSSGSGVAGGVGTVGYVEVLEFCSQ